jgi:hypothetical protein
MNQPERLPLPTLFVRKPIAHNDEMTIFTEQQLSKLTKFCEATGTTVNSLIDDLLEIVKKMPEGSRVKDLNDIIGLNYVDCGDDQSVVADIIRTAETSAAVKKIEEVYNLPDPHLGSVIEEDNLGDH